MKHRVTAYTYGSAPKQVGATETDSVTVAEMVAQLYRNMGYRVHVEDI